MYAKFSYCLYCIPPNLYCVDFIHIILSATPRNVWPLFWDHFLILYLSVFNYMIFLIHLWNWFFFSICLSLVIVHVKAAKFPPGFPSINSSIHPCTSIHPAAIGCFWLFSTVSRVSISYLITYIKLIWLRQTLIIWDSSWLNDCPQKMLITSDLVWETKHSHYVLLPWMAC